ncbi:hypothetical protein [Leuconostoc citreum]
MIADKITANMDTPNSKGDTNVEFTQNITMPAYSTPREMQRQAQQQFEKAFNPA